MLFVRSLQEGQNYAVVVEVSFEDIFRDVPEKLGRDICLTSHDLVVWASQM